MHSIGINTYFVGAFSFTSQPPFRITSMSPSPLLGKAFSSGWTYKNTDFVIFPMSFLADEHFIDLTYGKNDRETWVLRLNRTDFFSTHLRPVHSVVLGVCEWDEDTGVPDPTTFYYTHHTLAHDICNGPCDFESGH